jgi:hypothetical protein
MFEPYFPRDGTHGKPASQPWRVFPEFHLATSRALPENPMILKHFGVEMDLPLRQCPLSRQSLPRRQSPRARNFNTGASIRAWAMHWRRLRRQAAAASASTRRGRRVLTDRGPSARRPERHGSTQPAELAHGFPGATTRGVDGDDREVSPQPLPRAARFPLSVSREFITNCRTPILVLPDDTPSHPLPTSVNVASLAPNAEITVFLWREPPGLRARTINRVRTFLKSHVPKDSAAQ